MDLNHVSIFARVVELESFTGAANQLGLPKSSVSRTVSRLEEELGVRLLQRTTRKLHLTDAGHAYYDRARVALAALEEAATAATTLSTVPRGIVRVTAPNDLGVLNLADALLRFARKYPEVHVDLTLTSRFVDLVAEGFDLAVRAGKLTDSTLVARKIGSDMLGLFAAASYLKQHGKPKSFSELAQHRCVLFRGKNAKAEWRLAGPNGEESVTVRGPISVDEMAFAQQAVSKGMGIGLLPMAGVKLGLQRKEAPPLVRILPEYSTGGAGLYVVSPSVRFQSAAVTALREFIIEELLRVWNSL
ncbi:MAG TPA: LysR family transcriptional regulator [Polyangiaceae bacterium]|jgi:DNA-binding transcriptional LysR family regulator|nr:LysR family transcriptional regulator [Polyangiaceae bacterium]